ncbi:MAG: PD-(D/E)XK nuclease family protein, partial [Hydrogenophaga sp.]|nr:PD-(D/E)XK nuclease family protein [Hydrogenophaga sp.]
MATASAGFPPRFESTRNWATSLAPFAPGPNDLSGDTARDSLIAARWIDQVAGRSLEAGLRATLIFRLVEAARQLAPLAAARPPERRMAWAEGLRAEFSPVSPGLRWEGMVASLALTWAGLSAYATDVLWSTLAQPAQVADALLVVAGFQEDPLALALLARWGDRGALLNGLGEGPGLFGAMAPVACHACGDAEDEAHRAAACVISLVNAEQVPVALVAQDRALTRRIGAMLHGEGLSVRDETGWKLSTTHAAARLMSLLRAADRLARTDDVIDWMRSGAFAPSVMPLERAARELGLSSWRSVRLHPLTEALVPEAASTVLQRLQSPRSLLRWLTDL